MPGEMDGIALARWIVRERPNLGVLLISGRQSWPFVAKPRLLTNVVRLLWTMAPPRLS
jgi:hypothetical protein